ncbi:MAG: hypothetical protein HY748_17735 [Elusimicrobia bacterium]|nr:hypothetical protein [Elusimicrobiota bacterium]
MKRSLCLAVMAAFLAACGGKEPPHQPAAKSEQIPGVPTRTAPVVSRNEQPNWLKELSPEAQKVWLESKHKPDLGPQLAGWLGTRPAKTQIAFITAQDGQPDNDAYRARREAEDRAEFVRPAPKGFGPEGRRKIRLTLIPKKAMMKTGETFWYRLELQNVGREPILFDERSSFWKVGNGLGKCRFRITPPGGKEQLGRLLEDLDEPFRKTIVLPEHLATDEEKQRYARDLVERQGWENSRRYHLYVNLQPGETLVTRAWRFGTEDERLARIMAGDDPHPPISGDFRELPLEEITFDQPGTYRIKVVYKDPPPKPPTEAEIQRKIKLGLDREYQMRSYQEWASEFLGIVESNTVLVEVYK